MNTSVLRTLALGATLALPAAAMTQVIQGAGATFPAPVYVRWAAAYHEATGARIDDRSVGSGAGIRQIKAKTVDFGASDAPLSDAELLKSGLMQFPIVIGGVVPVVNIKGIGAGQMKITGAVLGDIYLGKVIRWNDPSLVALNPGMPLPDAAIAVVRRADASGTSFIFTNYLSKLNTVWKDKVGEGTAVDWPTGAAGTGNEGVSAFVMRVPNSIGYVEHAYARQNQMAHVQLRNQQGVDVNPTDMAFKAAAASADWARSFFQVLTEQPGRDSWPMTGTTYILMQKQQGNPHKVNDTLKFFEWVYAHGDKMAEDLGYAPLPAAVKDLVRMQWTENLKSATSPSTLPK